MDHSCNKENAISGIKCDVKNCNYHTHDDCCVAGEIQVGPSNAEVGSQTKCGTFEAKF